MLTFILRRLRASTVLLAPYEKLQRRLLKAALGLFGSADNAPRVQAILLVRQMALDLPQPALDNCLKVRVQCGRAGGCWTLRGARGMLRSHGSRVATACGRATQGVYRAFSSNAKFVNAASVPQINFMAAAVVEMYGINAGARPARGHARLAMRCPHPRLRPCRSRFISACVQLHPSARGAAALGAHKQEQGGIPGGVLLAGVVRHACTVHGPRRIPDAHVSVVASL